MIVHTVADTAPTWTLRLKSRGSAFPLTAAGAAVSVRVKLSDAQTVIKAATITDAPNGVVTVTFAAGDLDVAGLATVDVLYTATGGIAQHCRRPIPLYIRAEYSDIEQ